MQLDHQLAMANNYGTLKDHFRKTTAAAEQA
jgi:hypothetical protein